MKFISVFFIVLALWITWKATDYQPAVAVETHNQIQVELEKAIRKAIAKHRPGAKQIYFEKMWTETLEPTRVAAYFEYSFYEASEESAQPGVAGASEKNDSGQKLVRQTVRGRATLNREGSAKPDEDAWAVDEVQVTDTHLMFEEGLLIEPEEGASRGQGRKGATGTADQVNGESKEGAAPPSH